jgi:glucuronoarabinoxylan endo-1,4-beta-xylanase
MKRLFLFIGLLAFSAILFSQTAVTIDLYKTYQTITGFGGHDPRDQQTLINNDLGTTVERIWLDPAFKSSSGGGYNFDAACTPSKASILIEKANGVTVFIATPWSPPGWMKVNNNVNGGNISTNILRTDMYSTYADYLVVYAKQFKSQIGIDLYAISMQNEPAFDESYPSCIYTPDQMRDLIKLVGPKLKAAGLKTTIYCAEDMGSFPTCMPWFQSILGDTIARKYVGVWAVHGYTDGVGADMGSAPGWSSIYNYLQTYKIPLWMTETSGYFNNWTDAMNLGQAIHLALRHGKISAWFWWRMVIATSEASFWEDEALVMGSTPNKTYYASKNYYKYIRPGSQQVESSCTDADVLATAFTHGSDKRLTIVLINKNASSSKTLKITGDKLPSTFTLYTTSASDNFANKGTLNTSSFTIPANSINTLVYTATNKQPTINKIDTVAYLMKKPGQAANYVVNLSGISDGGGEAQTVSLSETHTNTAWFSSFTIAYTSPNATGAINFSPVDNQTGNTNVSLTISDGSTVDNGFFSTQKMSFVIKLIPYVNHAPTVTPISIFKVQKANANRSIYITGIGDGDDGTQKVTLTAVSSDNTIVTNVYMKNYSNGSTAEINMRPVGLGTATVTLTLKDDGGTWLGGKDTKTIQIQVQVLEVYGLEQNKDDDMRIYPNPANQQFTIENQELKYTKYAVIDINGKIALEGDLNATLVNVDATALSNGVYIVKLIGSERIKTRKIIIEK